jgi:hypothetical protein
MSPTYTSSIVVVLSSLFTLLKVEVDQENLTQIVVAVITLVSGIVIAYRRYKLGDISVAGKRK